MRGLSPAAAPGSNRDWCRRAAAAIPSTRSQRASYPGPPLAGACTCRAPARCRNLHRQRSNRLCLIRSHRVPPTLRRQQRLTQQAQAQQLTEQMRQLQMAGQQAAAASLQQQQQAAAAFQQQQQAAAAFQQQQQQEQAAAAFHHHQQQQQQQQAAAAFQQQQQQQQRVQATTAQHPAAVLGALQKAFIERDAELGIMAGALGVPLEQLLSAVAAHVGMPLQQLARERQQALAGGPVSPQLLQAVRLVDRARGDPQLAATLLQAQAQAQHLAELQQRALGGQQEALAQLGPNLQALALLQGQLQAATAGLGSNGGSAGGGGGLMPGMQAQQGGPQVGPAAGGVPRNTSLMGPGQHQPPQHLPPQRGPPPPALARAGHPADPSPQRGGAVASALVARQLAAAGSSAADVLEELRRVVEECVAPSVMHHRQEELGDMWLETCEDRERPPWDARSTLRAIFKHKSIFTW